MTPFARRQWLGALGAALALPTSATPARSSETPVVRPRPLVFPRDAGAHPEFRTEWWYLTGWANTPDGTPAYGFQLTFFRSRVDRTQGMRSRLAARQLLFAHAALTDVRGKRMAHDQRLARWSGEAPGSNPADAAAASLQDTGIQLRDWALWREGEDLRARIPADGFVLDLRFQSTQPLLLQGRQGVSRKGPEATQASYYYSQPQLRVQGQLELAGRPMAVAPGSTAWLDHEWSEAMLPPGAVGWDWLGINFLDGSALTAFQVRDAQGHALWDGGSFRSGDTLYGFQRGEVLFKPERTWRSPKSQAVYPVQWLVRTPADFYTVRALVDAQELDTTASTGTVYWEGLCEVLDSNQRLVGRGYLEMTGYASAIRLQS